MANRNIDKKYHYLYKTTNLINNKYYYGIHSTNKLKDDYLGSGVYLRRSIRKYGKENFKREIFYYFDNREELVQAEIDIITESVLRDKQNMNCRYGGETWNTSGMVTVKDKDGNTMKVFCDDPRYLSGEFVFLFNRKVTVKDKNGNNLHVSVDDPRYLSGELVPICKDMIIVKDKMGNTYQVNKDDPKYLNGELVGITTGMVTVKDKNDNYFNVSVNDPRYLSGELKFNWFGKKHSEETKKKISESTKGKYKGDKNSQFGTCWITKEGQNKKIKKEELQSYIEDGWIKGRKIK